MKVWLRRARSSKVPVSLVYYAISTLFSIFHPIHFISSSVSCLPNDFYAKVADIFHITHLLFHFSSLFLPSLHISFHATGRRLGETR